jgi:hypothetical protein
MRIMNRYLLRMRLMNSYLLRMRIMNSYLLRIRLMNRHLLRMRDLIYATTDILLSLISEPWHTLNADQTQSIFIKITSPNTF